MRHYQKIAFIETNYESSFFILSKLYKILIAFAMQRNK